MWKNPEMVLHRLQTHDKEVKEADKLSILSEKKLFIPQASLATNSPDRLSLHILNSIRSVVTPDAR